MLFFINNIGITTKLIVWPLIHYIRPSLWNFGFPRYGYFIVITTSDGSGYCFKENYISVSHMSVELVQCMSVVESCYVHTNIYTFSLLKLKTVLSERTVLFLLYIVMTTSDGCGYCFQAHFCSISKDVINTCWWFHSCAVCNYHGRLTDNLSQAAGNGYSLKLFLEWAAWWKPVNI